MFARRILTFLVLLLVVTALSAALVAPLRPRPAPPSPAPDIGGSDSASVSRVLDARQTRPRTITVRQGDLLELTVRSPDDDAVELQGLGPVRPVAPESPVTFSLFADAPGEYPVVLVDAARTVGTVRIVSRR